MGDLMWVGTFLGGAIGAFHAVQTCVMRWNRPGLSRLKTLWNALWIWAIWTLLGAYVLALWIIGLVGMVVARALRRKRSAV